MQNVLKAELVRITTKDGLELQGLLYEPPQKTDKIVIHIHGWTGNFYENVFLDYIAKACIKNNVSFLSFNTRGAGFVQEFLKKKNGKVEYIKIGGSLENFTDCIIDIRAVMKSVKKSGFTKIFLEGHSTGCQKAAYYSLAVKELSIKGLILLEPADDPSVVKRFLGDRYEEAIDIATKFIKAGKPDTPMPDWVPFGIKLSAQKFFSMSDPRSIEGELFSVPGTFEEVKKLKVPVLIISADTSEYQDANIMQNKIKKTINDVEAHIISHSGHWFFGHEEEMSVLIHKWLAKITSQTILS